MNARLMHPDRDFDPSRPGPGDASALTQDLALAPIVDAMAGEDRFLAEVARSALLAGPWNDRATILYRQAALQDCLRHPDVARRLYAFVVDTIEQKRKHSFGLFSRYPSAILHGAVDLLQVLAERLRTLRDTARAQAGRFQSDAFTNLFAMLEHELGDEYLARIHAHLRDLRFRDGLLLSAGLGPGNRPTGYVLRRPRPRQGSWWARLLGAGPSGYSFQLAERDEAGARALADMQGRAINAVANALAQSAEHIVAFFEALRAELAFYVAALNLHERLASLGAPVGWPRPAPPGSLVLRARGLYDVSLALQMGRPAVGNALDADGKRLVIITGPNQGGKSSFLRGIGLAHLMMHAGLFVGAEAFEAAPCTGLFTHWKREEDVTMTSGKFDEELARMSDLADRVRPGALVLFNESFAATNEREGSAIARQVVSALLEHGVRVVFVTHLFEFARGWFETRREDTLFLRAERRPDGTRTFRILEGQPLDTSHGRDLYRRIFASRPPAPAGPGPAAAAG